MAYYLTKQLNTPTVTHSALLVRSIWCPATLHRFDHDNAQAALKSAYDGLAQALGVNDCIFVHKFETGPKVQGGQVTIEVYGIT